MAERFVVLGLAPARSVWFRNLGHWSTSGALAAEFVKCVSAEEVGARLASGRPFSALVADAGLPAVDRDLLGAARAAGCAPFVVDDGRASRDWPSLGAAAVLAPTFSRDELASLLGAHARPIARGEARSGDLEPPAVPSPPGWRCPVAAVTGPGGTGVSTAAIALAQALGDDARHDGLVCLADLRLHAEQAMLHDAGDVLPSLQELVEAHRAGQPTPEEVRAQAFAVVARNYHLLLGLRQARFWAALRRRAFEATFDSLQGAYRVVVCDVDADLEGESDGGSIDVEERHVMTRTAMERADAVFAVGLPSMKGVHALVRVVSDALAFGVPPERVVPVVNCAPRSPRSRAALAATLAELVAPAVARAGGFPGRGAAAPVFLPERKVEEALLDGARVPSTLGAPLAGAFGAILDRAAPGMASVPERVRPGSLGHWAEPEAEAASG
jgi:Mrp family chromosome partitioning ATPase